MWLSVATLVLSIASLASCTLGLLLAVGFARKLRAATSEGQATAHAPGGYAPSVGVVVPCKGANADFEEDIRAILRQDYPNYRVVFATAGEADPAFSVLSRLVEAVPTSGLGLGSVCLVTSRPSGHRAQKIDNQLRAVAELGDSVEVYRFWTRIFVLTRTFWPVWSLPSMTGRRVPARGIVGSCRGEGYGR